MKDAICSPDSPLLPPTRKLYDSDAYATAFDAKVLLCQACPGADGWKVVLDRTCFFPEGGGQSADTGTINGIAVTDVQIEGELIYHVLSRPLPSGSAVHGEVNWTERYSKMQQHSGEHILSGLVHRNLGYDNVGFHLGNTIVTLDFNGPLSAEDLYRMEWEANRAIWDNIEITAAYPPSDQLAGLHYRSKKELTGPVRIVTIPGFDICACCAPHVRRTGEIGLLKIVEAQSYKGGMRLTILCGDRALTDYGCRQNTIKTLSAMLSAKPESIPAAVTRLKEETASLKGRLAALQKEWIADKAAAVPDNTGNLFVFERELDPVAQRNYVNLLTAKCSGLCGVFVGTGGALCRYIIGSRLQDVRPANQLLKEQLGAKGGGSCEMAQGTLSASEEQIRAVLSDYS